MKELRADLRLDVAVRLRHLHLASCGLHHAAACRGASTTPPPLSCHDHIPTQFRPKQTISSARAARSLVQPLKVGAPCGTSCRRHRTEPTQLGPGGAFLGSLGGTARHRFFGRPSLEGLRTDKKHRHSVRRGPSALCFESSRARPKAGLLAALRGRRLLAATGDFFSLCL